jgi:hypothetical protein
MPREIQQSGKLFGGGDVEQIPEGNKERRQVSESGVF